MQFDHPFGVYISTRAFRKWFLLLSSGGRVLNNLYSPGLLGKAASGVL